MTKADTEHRFVRQRFNVGTPHGYFVSFMDCTMALASA